MSNDPQTLDAELFSQIVIEMMRRGQIQPEVVHSVADHFDNEAEQRGEGELKERFEHLAHLARCLILEASGATPAEWRAAQRRGQMKVVPIDGGNPTV